MIRAIDPLLDQRSGLPMGTLVRMTLEGFRAAGRHTIRR